MNQLVQIEASKFSPLELAGLHEYEWVKPLLYSSLTVLYIVYSISYKKTRIRAPHGPLDHHTSGPREQTWQCKLEARWIAVCMVFLLWNKAPNLEG